MPENTLASFFQNLLSTPQSRWNSLPQSQNIEDRRGHGPLEQHIAPQPLNFGAQPYAVPMEGRVSSPMAASAGYNDVPEFDEMTDARSSAFTPDGRPTSMDQFRGTLGLNGMMEDLMRGGNSPLLARGRR